MRRGCLCGKVFSLLTTTLSTTTTMTCDPYLLCLFTFHWYEMRNETISIEVLTAHTLQLSCDNDLLSIQHHLHVSRSRKTHHHWSDFIWLKRIIVIISDKCLDERISDVWSCISNVEQRLQSHKFFISSLKAKIILFFNLNWRR